MSTAEAIEQPREATSPNIKAKLIKYGSLVSLVGAVGGGAFIGYNHVNGVVSSNHRDHQARIDQYDRCEVYVNANDHNGDGVARVKLEDMPEKFLQACGFGSIYDETAKSLDHMDNRPNLLDGWVVNFGLTGTLQLPSRQALEQAVSDEHQASADYAHSVRGEGIIVGVVGGFAAWFASGFGIIVAAGIRGARKEFKEEIAAGPHDWVGLPSTQRPAPYDWWSDNA